MERSLSVLLPVHNAQSTLAGTVGEILDVLPELTSCFELVVVDDGSTDATLEVADDLATRYPQVRAVRHAKPLGRSASVHTGLRHVSGDVVFLRDPESQLTLDEVHKLWRAIDEHPYVLGKSEPARRSDIRIDRTLHDETKTLRMVDRRASRTIRKSPEEQAQLMTSPAEQDGPWFEVELKGRCSHRVDDASAAHAKRRSASADTPKTTSPATNKTNKSSGEHMVGPKYLRRLGDFALGE